MATLHHAFRRLTALLGVAALFSVGCTQASGPSLTVAEALAQAQAGEITLIDIRTPLEWRQTGVAPVAHRIDMQDDGFASKVLAEVGGDKSAPIALICRTGNRSGYMQQELMRQGFTHVYDVSEGMAGSRSGPGWIRSALPIEACTGC